MRVLGTRCPTSQGSALAVTVLDSRGKDNSEEISWRVGRRDQTDFKTKMDSIDKREERFTQVRQEILGNLSPDLETCAKDGRTQPYPSKDEILSPCWSQTNLTDPPFTPLPMLTVPDRACLTLTPTPVTPSTQGTWRSSRIPQSVVAIRTRSHFQAATRQDCSVAQTHQT